MAYISISITAPGSAKKGEVVSASVRITNVTEYHYSFKGDISAVPARYPDYVIGSIDQVIMSGSSVTRNVSFTMPDCDVTVFIWVERWASDHWAYAGSASKVVSVEVSAETFHLSVLVPSWATGGYIDPGSGDYPAFSTVRLTAHPLSGYQFTSWGGDASGTSLTYNLYMGSDKQVEAYFEKVPVPEYPDTDIKDIAFSVVGEEYPPTDIKEVTFSVVGEEYPPTDIKEITFSVVGEEYPVTDIKEITFSVVGIPTQPEEPEEPGKEKQEFPWVPIKFFLLSLTSCFISPLTPY